MKLLTAKEITALNNDRFKAYRRSILTDLGKAEADALCALPSTNHPHGYPSGQVFKKIEQQYQMLKLIVDTLSLVEADAERRSKPVEFSPTGITQHTSREDGGNPFPTLRKTGVKRIVGRKVVEYSPYEGSYGMGGPGFVGITLDDDSINPREKLVLCLWGADDWLLLNGELLADENSGVSTPKKGDALVGTTLVEAKILEKSCKLRFKKGKKEYILELPKDTSKLPVFRGDGTTRILAEKIHLLDAWIVTPQSATPWV